MIDVFGYIGLSLSLLAITNKRMISFRLWHIASSMSYIIYGALLGAWPIIISGSLFIIIHVYNLSRKPVEKVLKKEKQIKNNSC